jgi:chromate reductase
MDDKKIKVLGVAGSLRESSYNKALLRAAVELQPDNMQIETFDISDIPLYNDDELADTPQTVIDFKQKIVSADALLIVTPEYNYSIPGVLKNAIDWASRPPKDSPLNGKPLAIMGATSGRMGTVRAQLHLRQIAVFTNMLTLNKPEVLVANANEKFDKDGNLTDESTRQHVKRLLDALAGWIVQLNK